MSLSIYPSQLKFKINRSRQSFVSPLRSSKKKPRLDEEHNKSSISDESIRGQLEFSHQDSHHVTPVTSSSCSPIQDKHTLHKDTVDKTKIKLELVASCLELLQAER